MVYKTNILKKGFHIFFIVLMMQGGVSCKKYLADVPDDRFSLLDNLEDLQGLLDGISQNSEFPGAMVIGSDDFYIDAYNWSVLPNQDEKGLYIWKEDAMATDDWYLSYKRIFTNNIVLESLNNIKVDDDSRESYERIKGSALFLRAYNFYCLAQLFAPQFDASTADNEAMPLRLTSDVDAVVPNGTVKQVYERIRKDCLEAKNLLPKEILFITRPSRAAVWALLARTYLLLREPLLCKQAVDSSLFYYDRLYDYNEISDPTAEKPFTVKYNTDIIFMSRMNTMQSLDPSIRKVDTVLYNSYHEDDLRKTLFFNEVGDGTYGFKGNYNESDNSMLFCGLAVDELYLTRAECKARLGDVNGGLEDLNTLMERRFKKGRFNRFVASTGEELLEIVLTERRKELVFRGTRWSDLRRLNMEGRFQYTLIRKIENAVYTLQPNAAGYVLRKPAKIQ